jgi:flagellar protein FlgJ
MEIGSINSNSTIDSAQTKSKQAADDDFEKKLKAAAESGDNEELKEVCHQFESIFISMMFKQMRATVPESDYLQSDSATKIYNSMLDDELCEAASKRGIGLADMMYKQMSKQYSNQGTSAVTSGGVIDEKK